MLGIGEAALRAGDVAVRGESRSGGEPRGPAPLLETRGLCRDFGALAAVRDIDSPRGGGRATR